MSVLQKINVGVVGACKRGASFKNACDALEAVRVHAVCDVDAENLDAAATLFDASEKYIDYEEMLAKSELDAVIIATPMHLHATQSILAMQCNLHVLSEVTAAVSLEECRHLVQACSQSRGIYMMAENANFMKPNVMVRELVRQGLFGTPYYAEAEYLHELKKLNEQTPWRRRWQTGIDGVTYGTHSLGPVLQWMPGERVTEVCCSGSGHHHRDAKGNVYENQDSCVMLCRMASGGLVKIRVDMLSDRPQWLNNFYQLQGTDGCYESARAASEKNRIWLRAKDPNCESWMNLEELENEFLPATWKQSREIAEASGHGGSDYFAMVDFAGAVAGSHPPAIGIHEAMDMTLPGLISQQSIAEGGQWLAVPDSRQW